MDTPAVEQHVEILDIQTQNLRNPSVAAIFTVFVDHRFIVRDCTLRRGARGLYAAFPARKVGLTEYQRLFEPVATDLRLAIERAALLAYQQHTAAHETEVHS